MAKNIIVISVWFALLFHSFIFLPTHAQTEAEEDVTTADPIGDANDSFLPSTVAEIVQAISNVQRNVTETASKVPNIKVAGRVQEGKNSSDGRPVKAPSAVVDPQLELTLFEPDFNFSMDIGNEKQDTKDAQDDVSSTTIVNDTTTTLVEAVEDALAGDTTVEDNEEGPEETVTETPIDGNLTVSPYPPAVSIFSYDGASQWFNWAVAMRDPTMNPEGTLSWPTIVTRGMQGIFQYYNPLRRFMARSLETANTLNSVASDIYKYRREVIAALLANEINPDMDSINEYVKNLESNKKVAERISLLTEQKTTSGFDGIQEGLGIPTIGNVTQSLDEALDQLFEPLDTVPEEWDRFAGIFGDPISGVLRAPFYIKFVNFGLKALYILIILAYIPFSGIENFFLAPLPPNIDTYPGMLRFWGLQAFLGPEFIEDYDAELEGLSGEVEAAASSVEGVVVDNDGEVRRLDGGESEEKIDKKKVPKKSIEKKPVYYNDIPDKIKPPPSRYGMDPKLESSYVSYNSQLKGSTSSSFAVIQDSGFVTSRPVSYGLIQSGLQSTHLAKIDDGTGADVVPVAYSARPPAPTAVRYMILSNNADMKSTTQGPLLISTHGQSETSASVALAPVDLAEEALDNQSMSPSQQALDNQSISPSQQALDNQSMSPPQQALDKQSMSPSQQASGSHDAPSLPITDYYSLILGESIARPDFHVAEPIDPPSAAAVRNSYGYSVNTVPAGQGPVVLPFLTKAAPVASYTAWEIPFSLLQNTVTVTPSNSFKDALVASYVLQPKVSVVPTSSFSVVTVSTVSSSTAPATIIVTSVASSVSTKYGK